MRANVERSGFSRPRKTARKAGRHAVGRRGRLAQLGERLPYKQEVTGSIPVPPIRRLWGDTRPPHCHQGCCRRARGRLLGGNGLHVEQSRYPQLRVILSKLTVTTPFALSAKCCTS